MRSTRIALALLCALALGAAACGRYGPPRRAAPAGSESGIEIQKKGETTPEEPEEKEEEPNPQ